MCRCTVQSGTFLLRHVITYNDHVDQEHLWPGGVVSGRRSFFKTVRSQSDGKQQELRFVFCVCFQRRGNSSHERETGPRDTAMACWTVHTEQYSTSPMKIPRCLSQPDSALCPSHHDARLRARCEAASKPLPGALGLGIPHTRSVGP
jgi:hypothetical protein